MLVSALTSLMIGIVLARRFNVLVLAPAFMITVVLAIGTGLARTDATWSIGLTALIVIVGLQVGYLLGSGLRHVMALIRYSRLRSAPMPHPSRPQRPAH